MVPSWFLPWVRPLANGGAGCGACTVVLLGDRHQVWMALLWATSRATCSLTFWWALSLISLSPTGALEPYVTANSHHAILKY
jgi:hypothetical protein